MRMLRMESVQREVLDEIEMTLRTEFMANLSATNQTDSHEMMAEIFNSLDRGTENRFITLLEERNRDSADKIKSLMFTWRIWRSSMPVVCRRCCAAWTKTSLASL